MNLIRRSCAQCGIKGEITSIPIRWLCLDIATAFSLRAGLASPTGAASGQPVEGGVQTACTEGFANLYLFTAIPPLAVLRNLGNDLAGRINRSLLLFRLVGFFC